MKHDTFIDALAEEQDNIPTELFEMLVSVSSQMTDEMRTQIIERIRTKQLEEIQKKADGFHQLARNVRLLKREMQDYEEKTQRNTEKLPTIS